MAAKINGEDIFKTYGAKLVKGGYKELMSLPKTKAVIENKSRLKDGVDVTVLTFGSRRRVEDREVNLSLYLGAYPIKRLYLIIGNLIQ